MAKYNKKRARELKHDKFRDTTIGIFDRIGDRLEGQGRNILYGIAALVLLGLLIGTWNWWSNRKNEEARHALGRAMEIAGAQVTNTPAPNSTDPTFPTETARAQKAVEEFQKVAAKYSDPYRAIAQYMAANNKLTFDRDNGLKELDALSHSSDKEVSTMSLFSLAQAKETDGKYDEALAKYNEILKLNNGIIPNETVNLRIATIYEKQGKKKEAADILFNIVDASRKAKDPDGKPMTPTAGAREAATKLEKLDPERFAQLPPEAPPAGLAL